MTDHVLIVGGGRQFPTMLQERGARTSIICELRVLSRLREPSSNERVIGMGANAPVQEWLTAVDELHRDHHVTRVATFGERNQDKAAAIAEHLGLPMHSSRTITLVHHKPSMRRQLKELGVENDPWALVRTEAELKRFFSDHGPPCITKPAIGAGSTGIGVVVRAEDIPQSFETSGISAEWASGGVLVERLHRGPQFSVEAFSEDGVHTIVCITQKHSDAASFVELGHVAPAELPDSDATRIADHVTKVLNALGVVFGPTHTEIVLTDDGPRLIESHVRMAGDCIPDLVKSALGVDLVAYTVRQVLGERGLREELRTVLAQRRQQPPRFDAIWYAASRMYMDVEGIDVEGACEARSGIIEIKVLTSPGSAVRPLSSSDDRFAYARATGSSAEEAINRAKEAVSQLKLRARLNVQQWQLI